MKLSTIVALLVLLMLPLAACDQQASLRDAVARAITKTVEAQSFRATVNSITLTDTHTHSSSSEWVYAAPDCWHSLETVVLDGGGNVTISIGHGREIVIPSGWSEVIIVGGKCYVRQSNKPEWKLQPFIWNPRILEMELEPYRFLVNLEKLPDEEIRGVNCSHYRGKVDQDSYVDMLEETAERSDEEWLRPPLLESARSEEHVAELWIDGDGYIRQTNAERRSLDPYGKWATSFTIMRYSDFDEPITIEPPLTDRPTPQSTPTPTPTPSPPPPPPPPSPPAPPSLPPTLTVPYVLELAEARWGTGTSVRCGEGLHETERTFRFVEGSARNVSSERLASIICIGECWSGEYLAGRGEDIGDTIVEPGDSFDFYIEIDIHDDLPTYNCTIEFRDGSGERLYHRDVTGAGTCRTWYSGSEKH